jgi:hypothetical protein
MHDINKTARASTKKAGKLSKQAAAAHAKYLKHKLIADSLTNDFKHEQSLALELRDRVNEYEAILDYMYDEIDWMQADFSSSMNYINEFYQDEFKAAKSRMISKHDVLNRNGKCEIYSTGVFLFSLLVPMNRILSHR